MLGTKLFSAFILFVLVLTLVAENEVDAAPEPCKELFDIMFAKPEKLKKPKEDKKDVPDDSEKPKKAKKKQLQKLEKS
ncbi:unnamed protein product, partial [Brenthis ino]